MAVSEIAPTGSEKPASLGIIPETLVRVNVGHPREETLAVRRTYYLLLALNVMVNFDSGAIPAVIDVIQEELGISKSGMGLIGSMPYWGLFIASPMLGVVLKGFSQKEVLGVLLFTNAGMVVFFSYSTNMYQMMASRLLIGISQGGFVIYSPCWVDDMAPVTSKTLWMALLQAVVPLGVVFGYLVAGVMSASGIHWSWSLIIQAFVIGLLAMIFIALPYKYTDDFWLSPRLGELRGQFKTNMGMEKSIGKERSKKRKTTPILNNDAMNKQATKAVEIKSNWAKTMKLISNPVFSSLTMTLSVLWFVVTGIQYWATDFLTTVFQVDKGMVVACFAVVALTGPTIGVIVGGIVTDMRGGYEGPVGRKKTLYQCQVCALIATGVGIVAGIIPGQPGAAYWAEIACLWLLLFFGGSIVPSATGLMLASVAPDERQMASGLGQGAYNLFGYAMGTLLPGVLMEAFDAGQGPGPGPAGMHWGMRCLFGWAVFGVMGITWTIAANARMTARDRDELGSNSSASSPSSADARDRGGSADSVSELERGTDATQSSMECPTGQASQEQEATLAGPSDISSAPAECTSPRLIVSI